MRALIGWVVLTDTPANGQPRWQPDWDADLHTDRATADAELAAALTKGHRAILGAVWEEEPGASL